MPITQEFSMADIEAEIQKQIEAKEKVVINTLNYVGKSAVTAAREGGRYVDQTGNLRSSIGYIIVKNGSVLKNGGFDVIKGGGKGKSEGNTFIQSLISTHSQGIWLIMVAGMKYAGYVEAMGLDVLTYAELLAERKVPELLKQLGFKLQ